MQVTFFSLFMGLLSCSFFIVIIYILRKSGILVKEYGLNTLIALYLLCAVRIFLPFEFPFTQVIPIAWVMNPLRDIMVTHLSVISFLNILDIVLIIWLIGSLVCLYRVWYAYRNAKRIIQEFDTIENDEVKETLEVVRRLYSGSFPVTLRVTSHVNVPLSYGVLNRTIIIPEAYCCEENLFYILSHEYNHLLHNDILVKVFTNVFCAVFWWNPLVYLLKKDLEETLEMRCDQYVVEKLNKIERIEYMETMINSFKKSIECMDISGSALESTAALIQTDQKSQLRRRIKILAEDEVHKHSRKKGVVVTLLVCALFVLSYTFILQSEYLPPESEGTLYGVEDVTLIERNGKYYFVIDGDEFEVSEDEVNEYLEEVR